MEHERELGRDELATPRRGPTEIEGATTEIYTQRDTLSLHDALPIW